MTATTTINTNSNTNTTPTATSGVATTQNLQVVFVGGGNNLFYALKAASGEVLWTFNMTTGKPNDMTDFDKYECYRSFGARDTVEY
jgi:outer membrane protein assembly factor BamB